jgi:uncharacterized GH25 family protein
MGDSEPTGILIETDCQLQYMSIELATREVSQIAMSKERFMPFRWVRGRAINALRCAAALAAASAAVTVSAPALAHEVWLEADGAATTLYFGEFGDNLHEASPGYLDKLTHPTASVVSARGEKPLKAKRLRDGIAFAGRAAADESVVAVDSAYPLMEGKEGDKPVRTAWTPAARYVPELRSHAAKLALDVVPANDSGQFRVTFRGAPLPNAEVRLIAASGWALQGRTDAEGKVSFELPWQGTYVLLVRHKDPTPGRRQGAKGIEEAFDAASFATTLTFVTRSGLPSPPRPPAAAPNQPK